MYYRDHFTELHQTLRQWLALSQTLQHCRQKCKGRTESRQKDSSGRNLICRSVVGKQISCRYSGQVYLWTGKSIWNYVSTPVCIKFNRQGRSLSLSSLSPFLPLASHGVWSIYDPSWLMLISDELSTRPRRGRQVRHLQQAAGHIKAAATTPVHALLLCRSSHLSVCSFVCSYYSSHSVLIPGVVSLLKPCPVFTMAANRSSLFLMFCEVVCVLLLFYERSLLFQHFNQRVFLILCFKI